jgi:hypothetical protein
MSDQTTLTNVLEITGDGISLAESTNSTVPAVLVPLVLHESD